MDEIKSTTWGGVKFIKQYMIEWDPKEDITPFELAKCIPYIVGSMHSFSFEIPEESFMRHFKVIGI